MTETFHAGPDLGRLSDVTIIHGDCIEAMRELATDSIDAIVTDPPYGLEFMGKEWDAPWKAEAYIGRGGRHPNRNGAMPVLPQAYVAGVGFQQWCEEWTTEALRVLKPGGHLLAFGGTRTWHRLAVAVEDAGFEIRDSIAWLYGSGFPKSLDVSKAIDKRGGHPDLVTEIGAAIRRSRVSRGWSVAEADRKFCSGSTNWSWYEGRKGDSRLPSSETFALIVEEWPELAAFSREVAFVEREVVGFSQGRSKSVHEGRQSVGTPDPITAPATPEAGQWQGWGTALKPAHEPIIVARKPFRGTVAANVLAHGTGALNIDACRIETTDNLNGGAYAENGNRGVSGSLGPTGMNVPGKTVGKAYEAPAGRWPANVCLDSSQAAALDEQSGTSVSRVGKPRGAASGEGWGMTTTGAEYADTGGASRFFYCAKAPKKERPTYVDADGKQQSHATVKPLALMRWLVRLVTPPGGVVLDPFAGSGTTIEAALLEGFRVIGIEREADYLPMIQQRIARCLNS